MIALNVIDFLNSLFLMYSLILRKETDERQSYNPAAAFHAKLIRLIRGLQRHVTYVLKVEQLGTSTV